MSSKLSGVKQASCLSLVDDELLTCWRRSFRLQVGRGKKLQPVVLMLGIEGRPPPDYCTCRLAHIGLSFVSSPPVPAFFHIDQATSMAPPVE